MLTNQRIEEVNAVTDSPAYSIPTMNTGTPPHLPSQELSNDMTASTSASSQAHDTGTLTAEFGHPKQQQVKLNYKICCFKYP